MSKSSDGGGGGDGSITVDDDFLTDFANKQLNSFNQAVLTSAPVLDVYNWTAPLNLPNTTPGTYDQIMGGGGSDFAGITTDATKLFSSIYTQIGSMHTEMQKLSTSLLAAKTTLSNGESDSLTTAQMMDLLNPALGSPSTTSTQPPLP
ncbi:hypothetical protein [Streptacidiphilus albus]|uniref:hypothetical protein n=1 Tax=Streptacidiphilus albus TaxID=105425 RepID=UPI00054C0CDD|nr:hypothetical protein [Streptacidiphilus albus]